MKVRRRLAAIMAADVVGYSRLMGRDEEGTQRRVKSLIQDVIRPAVSTHRGRLVKTTGDGVLIQFDSVFEAFQCALVVLQAVWERGAQTPEEERIALRVGLNVGDIILDDGDVFGEGVNIAARLEAVAPPGGVCVSARAWEDLRKLDVPFNDLGELSLKNIAQPVRAYTFVLPGAGPAAEPVQRTSPAPSSLPVATALPATRWRRGWILALAGVAVLVGGGGLAAHLMRPRPDTAAFVATYLAQAPCAWLQIADRTDAGGIETYRLSGAAASHERLADDLVQAARRNGARIDRVAAEDVTPLTPDQCAVVDRLKGSRYTGAPRLRLDVGRRKSGVTRIALTLDPADLGRAGALYGIEPSGAVERIVDVPALRRLGPPAVIRQPDGTVTLNIDVDSAGWNGVVLMEADAPPPAGLIERGAGDPASRERFAALAQAGRWRFEPFWFRIDP